MKHNVFISMICVYNNTATTREYDKDMLHKLWKNYWKLKLSLEEPPSKESDNLTFVLTSVVSCQL